MASAAGYLGLIAVSLCLALLGRLRARHDRRAAREPRWLVLPGDTDPQAPQISFSAAPAGIPWTWDRAAGYALTIASVSALAVTAMASEAHAESQPGRAHYATFHDLGLRAQAPLSWLALEAGFDFDQLGPAPTQGLDQTATAPLAGIDSLWPLTDAEPAPTAWMLAPHADDIWA